MIIYSEKIIQFATQIGMLVKNVLSKEIGLKVRGDRFYDKHERASYPIKIVIYNNKSMLGYFDSDFYELGFHECLMHTNKDQLHDVVRHELAHYMTFINHGEHQPHGSEFKAFCKKMGWNDEVSKATIHLEKEESPLFRKVQKLMALSSSSNPHEAELAMIKSRELLLKHNIDYDQLNDDERVFLKRIMKQKKESAKMRAIGRILETFFVSIVYMRAGGFIHLEVLGSKVNVEIAEYVANVLQSELDNLWDQAQTVAKLRGQVAKNSFFLGLAKGYCNKIEALKKEATHALMVIEKQLTVAREMVYKRLSWSKSRTRHCQKSSTLGEEMGGRLKINPALASTSKSNIAYIDIQS